MECGTSLFRDTESAERYLRSVYDLFMDEEEIREFKGCIVRYQASLINLMVEESRVELYERMEKRTGLRLVPGTKSVASGDEKCLGTTSIARLRQEHDRALSEYNAARVKLKESLRL